MNALDLLFPAALLALAVVAVVGVGQPILARMAWRNTQRRRKQSLLIIGGLLVGTAIVSGALVASDSMEYAIVEATYDAFQHIDELVVLDGFHFFPAYVADELAEDSALARETDAVGANIIWDGAATNDAGGQYEPRVRLVGFDPTEDQAFGGFETADGDFDGRTLAPDEVVLHRRAADRLRAQVGDELTLDFSLPIDPLVPELETRSGTVAVSAGGIPPLNAYAEPVPVSFDVPVSGTVVGMAAILAWDPGPAAGQDLDLEWQAPDGTLLQNRNGTAGAPDLPAILNATGSVAQPLEQGSWTLRVQAKAAAQTGFQVTIVRLHAVYDLEEFQERIQALADADPEFDEGTFEDVPRRTRTVRVAAIAETGKGPIFRLPHDNNLYLRLDTLQEWLDRPGQVNVVKVSNRGGIEDGAESTDEVLPALRTALNVTRGAHTDHAAVQALDARGEKQFWLDQAKEVGETFTVFLTSVASFSVLAGLLLIINIFTMLADERRTELGISRAVGLQRRHLTRLFTLEGAYYALPAAFLGTVAGLGLAAMLIAGFNLFGDPQRFPPIPFRLEITSLLRAFAIGILLTLATVYIGSRRVARLNVVRAIRQLEEPERARQPRSLKLAMIAVAVAGAALVPTWFLYGWYTGLIFGPTLLVVAAALALRRRWHRRTVYPPLALLLFLYLAATVFLVKDYDTLEANVVSPMRAVVMTFCVIIIVVYRETTARAIARLLIAIPPLRAVARPALSYPLHRKFRTGMTLAMFGVVLMVVTLFSIFGSIFTPDPEKEAGAYDVEGFSEQSVASLAPTPATANVARYDIVPYWLAVGGTAVRVDNETTAQFGPPQDYLYGIDEPFAQANGFSLLRRDDAYATDAEAYLAVARDASLVIIAYPYSTDEQGNDGAHGPGSALQVEARGGVQSFRVIGVQEQVHFKGVFLNRDALAALYPDADTLILFDLEPGTDDEGAAQEIEAAYRDLGLDARSIREEVRRETETFRQIFALIQLFLSLGLIVGILSLGIVTARSVIERRQEIGMLRALGYRRRDVRRVFLTETLGLVALGIFVGALVAFVVSYGVWVALVRDLRIPYTVPWAQLLFIAAISLAATALATLGPITRAARTPPAEALRYIE